MMKYWFGAEVTTDAIVYDEKVIHVFVTKGALKRWLNQDSSRMPALGNVVERMLSVMNEPIRFFPDSDTAIISRYVEFCDNQGLYEGYSPIVGEVVPSLYVGCNVLMEEA